MGPCGSPVACVFCAKRPADSQDAVEVLWQARHRQTMSYEYRLLPRCKACFHSHVGLEMARLMIAILSLGVGVGALIIIIDNRKGMPRGGFC